MKLRKMKRSLMGFSLVAAMGVSLFSTGINVLSVEAAEPEEAVTAEEDATTSEETTAGDGATSSDAYGLDVMEPGEEALAEDSLEVKADQVKIDADNFPDENFRKYIKDNFDENNDDIVDNVENVTHINVSLCEIRSLKGIEFFWALQVLACDYNELTSLDVSKNTSLKTLMCSNNELTSLDVSKNTSLDTLWCDNNELTSLDVSKNTSLDWLNCHDNDLTSLDVSKNTSLERLRCFDNRLTSLDVSKNTLLNSLDCFNNGLTSLDVSKNTLLKSLSCYNNGLTSLDVSKNTLLTSLECYANGLTSLDVSKNTSLKYLYIDSNITTDISNTDLGVLYIYVPQLKGTIALSNITGIEKYMSGSGWDAGTKKLTYELKVETAYTARCKVGEITYLKLGNTGYIARYQGCSFWKQVDGNITCRDRNDKYIKDDFKCDGIYTYYFQADGTAMKNRLTYHPDGEHVIYFDEDGHEVFSNFHHVEKSIAGDAVDDLCFFDVYGYMYVDVMTYDQAGEKLYYVNPYGVIEQGKWFEFSDTCVWAGTANKVGTGYGYANADGTLMINTHTYDWRGNFVYMQGDGHMQ